MNVLKKLKGKNIRLRKILMNQEEQQDLNAFLKTLDIDRRKAFYKSLNKILVNVTNDSVVKQMLSSKNSCVFVTKRLEEIIYRTITDDREDYILKLGKKLHSLQKINENINNQNLRDVGKKVLDVSKRQNAKECDHQRTILMLRKQIKALQKEVVELRVKKVVKEIEKKETKPIVPERDPKAPDFLHIKRTMDITSLSDQLKSMCLDLMTEKQLINEMKEQLKKDVSNAKLKISMFYDSHLRETEELRMRLQAERVMRVDMQKKYDEDIIPQFLESKKQMAEKHREINESRLKDVEEMRKMLYQIRTEQKTSQVRMSTIENENKELKLKIAEHEKTILKLRSLNTHLRDEAEDYRSTISDKDITIRMLEETTFHMKDEISNLKNELAFSHKNEDEITRSKESIDKAYRQLQTTSQSSIEKAKTMAMEIERMMRAKERLSSKLDSINTKYDQLTYKEKETQRQISLLKKEISQLNRKGDIEFEEKSRLQENLRELETENDDLKRKIEEMREEEEARRIEAEDRENELEDEYQRRFNDQKSSLRRMMEEKDKTDKKNESLKKEIGDLKSLIETMKKNNEKEKEDKRNIEQKRRDAEDQLMEVEKAKDALQYQFDEQKIKIAQLEQRLTLLNQERNDLKDKMKQYD